MKILVVDDSRSVRMALRSLLEEAGYEVTEARDGVEALKIGECMRPDCITMDVQMPEMDGFEATARIRDTDWGRKVPIIFVTNMDSLRDREKGFTLGATEFISKNTPASWREVSHAIDRLLKAETRLEGVTILVVCADELRRIPVVECLRRQGGQIVEAANGGDAIDIIRNHGLIMDMVIAEWSLPDIRADALCAHIRKKEGYRTLPFIALIETGDRPDVLCFFASGGTDYVMKPFVKEEFVARVGVHLETRSLIKELRGSVEELERLSRVRDGFLAIASHDLKSPLNGILGFSQLMLTDKNLTEQHRKWLTMMVSAADFMLEIINDIVELGRTEARKESLTNELLPVLPLVKVAVSTLQQQAISKHILLDEHYRYSNDPVIRGDRNRFIRILNNLLSNSLKFTPEGGKITVTIDRKGEDVMLIIADTGIGIPPDMLSQLFEKYSKISRIGTKGERGTGLGMFITKQLVDQHNGIIEVSSTVGQGTEFRLTFPLVQK